MLVIAHLSDLHLDGGRRAADRVERVMSSLRRLPTPVDAVLITGDITDSGRPADYAEAVAALASGYPTLLCPGNHDARVAFSGAFPLGLPPGIADAEEPVNRAVQVAGVLFALCDSTIPGHDEGLLSDPTLAWLDDVLAQSPDLPSLVCCHHPPVDLHHPLLDSIRQSGEDRLAAVLGRHPQVVALLCGHAHTAASTVFAGRPLVVAPGTASTLRLPWEGGPDIDLDWPPALAYHVLGDDRRLTTHFRVVV